MRRAKGEATRRFSPGFFPFTKNRLLEDMFCNEALVSKPALFICSNNLTGRANLLFANER
ncbi:hypothetical protein HM1_0003 [Heliomicrobium modesticaldum Ice1]|uniref:Uncharacterized protein n=1 Tax=Heliobacterium modesticaldum (strain ATCC 51547 / Ice1) TaxID=498761 RepID=B0THV5_HELMI|nr:hypothetical protein HM1_0003 [Heliomicrobium modesticaldum Ice1]